MDSNKVLIRLKILEAISADSFEDAKSILRHALLETSPHWQENAMAAGLAKEDIVLDADIPYVRIRGGV